MDTILFHPKLVHLPVALAVLMPLVAGGLWLAWWRGWLPSRVWLIALALQAVLVGSGFLALRSGEAEEERVEAVVPEAALEAHEEAAGAFVVGAGLTLVGMAAAAVWRGRAALPVAGLGVLATLVVLGLGYRVGDAGGRLVYEHGAGLASRTTAGSTVGQTAADDAHDGDDSEDDRDDVEGRR